MFAFFKELLKKILLELKQKAFPKSQGQTDFFLYFFFHKFASLVFSGGSNFHLNYI